MNQIKPLILSHFQARTRKQIISKEPLVSSLNLGWQDFKFDYYQCNKNETSVYIGKHHLVSLALNQVVCEQKLDGIYSKQQLNFGSVGIMPANTEQYYAWKSNLKFIFFSFTPQALSSIAPETINTAKIKLLPAFANPEPDFVITGIGIGIKQQLERDPDRGDFYLEHLKNTLFAHLLKNYCTVEYFFKNYDNGLSRYKLKQVTEYINNNLERKIQLKDLAQLVDISQYYFCHLFHNSIGVSPYKYVIQQRVAKAKNLLKNSKLSLADIAYKCGFSSQSQMTQHFHKLVGITPKVYRDKL